MAERLEDPGDMTRATLGKAKIAGLMVKKVEVKHLEQRTRRMYIPVPSVRQHIEIERAPVHRHLWRDGLGISRTGYQDCNGRAVAAFVG